MLVYILKTEELPFELDPADTLETSAQEHRKCKIFGYSLGMWLLSSLFSEAHFIKKKILEQTCNCWPADGMSDEKGQGSRT